MKLKLEWVQKTKQYQNGKYLMLNRIQLGSVDRNGTSSTRQGKYVSSIDLPNIKESAQRMFDDSEENLMHNVEAIVYQWFTRALTGSEL